MSIAVLSRPIKSSCNWNAAGNPVIYKLRRGDDGWNQINNAGGFFQVQLNGVDRTSYYEVGNTAFVGSPIGEYVIGEITASSFSGGNTLVTLNVAYTASVVSGPINNLSKRTDYKVVIDYKRGVSPNDSLLNDVTLAISPDVNGLIYVDASILKSLLTPDWEIPSGTNAEDEGAYLPFYLSYQEYYDGALQGSVTNDSSNIIYLVHGANQIGHVDGSNMLAYYPGSDTKKWLTKFGLNSALQGLKMWRGWPFTLSFIWPGSVATLYRRITQYNEAGTELTQTTTTLVPGYDELNRLKITSVESDAKRLDVSLLGPNPGTYETVTVTNSSFDASMGGWVSTDIGNSAPVPWTYDASPGGQVEATAGGDPFSETEGLDSPAFTEVIEGQVVRLSVTVENTGVDSNIYLNFYDGVSWTNYNAEYNEVAVNGTSTVVFNFTAPINFTRYRIVIAGGISPAAVYISNTLLEIEESGDPITETLRIEVSDACDYNEDNLPIPWDNPIMLVWRNSLGGDACWLFQKFSEFTYSYQNGRKAPRMILFATDLTPVQWQAIQELNTVGEVYSQNIVDLENTNTINKTTVRVGASVYMIDQDGNKTGVVVIPQTDKVKSRNTTHSCFIEIELPEVQSI